MTEQEKLYWGVVRILENGERVPLNWTFDALRTIASSSVRALGEMYPNHCHELARFRAVHGPDSVKFEEVEFDD